MNRLHYDVNGLRNNNMKTQIKNSLDDLEGVNKVNVDLRRGSIEVACSDIADESQIRNQIEQIGCKIE